MIIAIALLSLAYILTEIITEKKSSCSLMLFSGICVVLASYNYFIIYRLTYLSFYVFHIIVIILNEKTKSKIGIMEHLALAAITFVILVGGNISTFGQILFNPSMILSFGVYKDEINILILFYILSFSAQKHTLDNNLTLLFNLLKIVFIFIISRKLGIGSSTGHSIFLLAAGLATVKSISNNDVITKSLTQAIILGVAAVMFRTEVPVYIAVATISLTYVITTYLIVISNQNRERINLVIILIVCALWLLLCRNIFSLPIEYVGITLGFYVWLKIKTFIKDRG